MNDVVYSLVVKKRSFEMEKNERKTFFWLELIETEIETENDSQYRCFTSVSDDFFSLEELVIRLQMAFPASVLEECTSIQHEYENEICVNVSGIEKDVLRDYAENCKNLIWEEKKEEMTEQDAERVMKFWLKKSGFERWALVGEEQVLMFKSSNARLGSYVLSWDDNCFGAVETSVKKTGPASCRDVVEMLLEISGKGREIYTTNPEQDEIVTLLKPFQSLEELLVEIDLSCNAEDVLDDARWTLIAWMIVSRCAAWVISMGICVNLENSLCRCLTFRLRCKKWLAWFYHVSEYFDGSAKMNSGQMKSKMSSFV